MAITKLMDALEQVEEKAHGETISLGDVVDTFNGRGFGALLILPSLLVVLPTGAIPFVPFVCGMFMILVCVQIVMGRHHPWMPRSLRRVGIGRERYEHVVDMSRPFIGRLDKWSAPRLKMLSRPISQRVIAIICIALSIATAAVALLPIMSHLFALAILCFAIGMASRDGFMTIMGVVVTVAAFAVMPAIIASSEQLMGPHILAPLPSSLS